MAINERKNQFSIRKFSFGAASVVIGISALGLVNQTVQAEESSTIMGTEVLENENKVKVMLDFFENPTPAIKRVNEQIAEIKEEKEVVRNPNDYSQDSFQNYTEAVKVAEAAIPAAEQAVEKAEEIQGKSESLRKEMETVLPPEVRKDINYNVVTQEQKRAMNDRFKEMYSEVNYRTTYISATKALSDSNTNLKSAVKALVESTAKELANDGTFEDKVPETSKIKVKSFESLTSDDQGKISSLIENHFNLSAFSPSFSYDNSNAIVTYEDKSITRLPLTAVAIAESSSTPTLTPTPTVKKAILESAISRATEALTPADTTNKTEDSVKAYEKALVLLANEKAKAEAVNTDSKSDQPKVDQAVKDLTAAITAVESTKSKLIEKPKPIVVEKDETKVEVKAYKTIRRDNADLDKGTEKIVQEGKDGSVTTVEHVVLVDGVETERKVVSTNKIDAVNQIIEVGTKEVVTPVKPVDSVKPVAPVKPADKTINNLEVSEKVQLPKTGTESNIYSALGISLMAVTVLGLFLREKDIVRNKRR